MTRSDFPTTADEKSVDGATAGVQRASKPVLFLAAAVLAAAAAVAYGAPMFRLVHRWWYDADYVYGFLVPVLAGIMLWRRREMRGCEPVSGSVWGLPLIALAAVLRWASARYFLALVDPLSFVPFAAGGVLFVGGWRSLRWAGPAIVFLVFAVPLPGLAANLASHPLQRIGTICSTYLLQMLGFPAVSQGNVILLSDTQLGVVEACSGLRMMMLFVAVSFAAAFLWKRPVLNRVVIILSAAPIALMANIARIVLTGTLHELVSHTVADALFHDLAGWLMMPLACLLLWVEIALFSRLLVQPAISAPLPLGIAGRGIGEKRRTRRKRSWHFEWRDP